MDWRRQGRYTKDVDALLDAITTARRGTSRSSMIVLNTILADADSGTPSVLLIDTGSEVQVALDARDLLQPRRRALRRLR